MIKYNCIKYLKKKNTYSKVHKKCTIVYYINFNLICKKIKIGYKFNKNNVHYILFLIKMYLI